VLEFHTFASLSKQQKGQSGKLVTTALEDNAKADFLDQSGNFKMEFVNFLQYFNPKFQLPTRATYNCSSDCFCNRKNQSKSERYRTFHLFSDVQLPDALKDFSKNTVAMFKTKLLKVTAKQKLIQARKANHEKRRPSQNEKTDNDEDIECSEEDDALDDVSDVDLAGSDS